MVNDSIKEKKCELCDRVASGKHEGKYYCWFHYLIILSKIDYKEN